MFQVWAYVNRWSNDPMYRVELASESRWIRIAQIRRRAFLESKKVRVSRLLRRWMCLVVGHWLTCCFSVNKTTRIAGTAWRCVRLRQHLSTSSLPCWICPSPRRSHFTLPHWKRRPNWKWSILQTETLKSLMCTFLCNSKITTTLFVLLFRLCSPPTRMGLHFFFPLITALSAVSWVYKRSLYLLNNCVCA